MRKPIFLVVNGAQRNHVALREREVNPKTAHTHAS
jgi:hypothetical protein